MLGLGCGTTPGPAPVTELVELRENGVVVGQVAASTLADGVPLASAYPASLPAMAGWHDLSAHGARGAALRVPHPAERYGDHDLTLVVDGQGHPALHLLRRAPAGVTGAQAARFAEPVVAVARLDWVDVWTQARPTPVDTTLDDVLLTVVLGGGMPAVSVDRRTLNRLPEVAGEVADLHADSEALGVSPRAVKQRARPGRRLADLVATVVSLDEVAEVDLVAEDGAGFTVSGDLLRSDVPAVLLRTNQKGEVVAQPQGSLPATTDRVRALRRVDVRRHSP